MAKRMPTVKELEAARKAADKVMLTSILANASKTAPKAAEGKTSAPSSAGLTVKPAATTTPVPPTVLPKVNSLGLLNPEIVNKYLQQGMAYAKQGPQSRMDIANSLLDFDIGDYKKGDVAGFNYDTMQEMNIRNRYFIGQHQRAGTFDFPEFITDKYIAFPSTDYLTKQNDAVMVALEESKAKDAAAAASKEQNADQEVAWQNLYKAKQEEKDFFDEWYNLLLADHLLNNSGQIWDFEAADARYGEDVMDDVTYEAELKRLREQMQGVDWATKTGYNTANYESQTPALQAKYDLISGQLQNRNKAAELEAFVRSQPDFDEKRLYVDNYTAPEKGSLEYIFSNDAFVQGLDDPLRYMHSDVNWASRELAGEYSGKAKYYFEHGYHLMAPEQLDTYTYLYQSKMYKEAADYIAAIQPELNKAMLDIITEFYTTRDETVPGAIIDSLWSVPGKIKGTLDTGAGVLMGKDDPNDPLYRTAQNVDTIRGVSGQTAGELLPFEIFGQKAGTFLYGLGMSTLDMIAAQKLAGIFGTVTGKADTMKNIMGAIMATEVGTDTFRSDLERGMGFEYSLGHGIANGLVNRWAESGFLDNLFSENGKFLTKVLKPGASEALGEVFESGMNLGTDAFVSYLTGKQKEIEQTYNYYVATVGKDKAAAATMQHYANQFASDGLAGFIMGETTSTVYNTGEYLDTRAVGKAVTKDGDIDTIMGIAQGMPETSESKRIYDEITGNQEKGKKPSFYQFGQLTKAIIKDLGEEHAAIVNRVQDEAIVERLVELGEDRTAAKQNASIIRRIARGEKVPRKETFEVKWSDNASQVVKELTRETKDVESFAPGAVEDVGAKEIDGKWVEGNAQTAEVNRTGNKWVTDMQNQQRAETENVRGKMAQVQVATITPIGKAANRAEEAAKKRVPKRDGKPKLATDSHVTFRGADGSAEISGDIMRFEESDEGMQVVVQTGKGKEGEQKVKLEDWISADGDGVATILSYIGDEQLPHSVTAEEANTLMQVYKHSGGNAKAVIQAFDVNYLAGYSGNNQVGSVLDPALSKIAYENGKRDAEKDEEQRKQRASEYKALENPVAGWIGKVDGREQVKGLGDAKALEEALQAMPESQRTATEIMIETGKAVGLNVVLYDSDGKGDENDIQNGMFDAVTKTVYFDVSAWVGNTKQLQAMKKQGTLGYAMLRVGGHELTHYLEVAAPEAYAKYSKAVKEALKAKGVDFAVQMRERIDKANAQGRKLTMAGAAAEVIADASEDMLQDSKLFNNLDTDTKGKIRAFLQNFAQKVKEIFQHLTVGHKESAALREMKNGVYHYLEGLQDLWDAGFDEILSKGTTDQSGGYTRQRRSHAGTEIDAESPVGTRGVGKHAAKDEGGVYANYYGKHAPALEVAKGTEEQSGDATEMVEGVQFSDREDQTETEAFKRWFGDSVVVNEDGTPKVLYHQTEDEFYVFDTRHKGAGTRDNETPFGIFMKTTNRDIGVKGSRQMALYARITNPLRVNNRAELVWKLTQLSPEYARLKVRANEIDAEYGAKTKEAQASLRDYLVQLRENEKTSGSAPKSRKDLYSDPDFMKVFNAEDEIVDEWTETAAANDLAAKEAITKALKNAGYDGIILKEDRGSWGRSTDAYIALDPAQVKSATDNVGTFDPENLDIRYSDRDLPDGVTIREYLGSMKPTSSMTETEKLLLKRYQDQLRTLEEKEKLVEEQEEIIRTAPFRNPDGSLNDEITKAKNRYKIYRDQANRAARALANAEKDEGFARLMATSRQVVNDYLLGAAGNVADAQDVLETEINELTRQLTKLEADVTRTSQGQRTAFARGLYNPDDLKAAAQQLKDTYGSRMSVQNIANRLALAYGELYANEGAKGAKLFMAASRDLATDLLAGNKYRYQSEILPMLREQIGTISLSDTDLQEIGNAGLTVTEYKRMLSPYIKVSAEGSDLSSYASNAEYYGNGALAAVLGDENEGNLAMRLYDVISQEKAKEADNGYDGMSESQLIGMAMADIAGANLPMSANSSTVEYLRKELLKYAGENAEVAITVEEAISKAKKATAKAGRIWLEAAKNTETARQAVEYYRALDEKRRVMELAEQKKQITEQLKSDTAKKLQEKVTAQREEYREREKKAREYRKTRDEVDKLRRKISRNVKRLNSLRVRETDQKHVPQELQHVADAVMSTFTDSELGRLVFHEAKLMNLGRTYRLLRQSETDAAYFWDDEIETDINNLQALGEAYGALRNREGNAPSRFSLEGVELETEILQGVDAIVSHVLNMIDATNTGFLYQRNETFTQFANKAGEKLRGHKDYKNLKGALGRIQHMLDENLRTGNTTPVYFFEHLENQEIMDVFDEIRKGMRQAAIIEREGKQFIEKAREQYNYGSWVADGKLTMKTGQGHTIELTREEAAEIYAIAKREAANKLYQTEHLLYGGFNYKHIDEKGKGLVRVKDESHQLDKADIAKISNWLTAEQKAYADALVGFLSTDMADYGNGASMKMYGYKKFTEQYYIPFHTVANQRFQKGDEGPQGENAGTGRVKNSGFTHKVQYKANQALYVGGISETVADHIHKMAAYAAMVEPIENMKRLLNHKMLETDGTSNTIRALIGQKYGQASEDYMTQLLKDLNGATMGDKRASGLTDKMIGAFKRGAVMASASVVLQQSTAMTRAMAMISPKYFTNNPFYRPGKGTWEEMLEHSGTAVIKDMGKFDVGMGLTATQYILDEDLNVVEAYQRLKAESKTKAGKAVYDRFMAWLTAAPGVADQWTWGLIWKAVKAEQADLHPDMDQTGDAFLDLVGERFDDVIDHTQVYDSVLTRSNLMRSQDGIAKAITVFKSEPTLSLNMLYDALSGWKSKRHTGMHRGRIIGSVLASQILAGAMAALAQAWNDDDDKRTAIEKYADRATGNIVDNLNPLKMIPLVSDIVSMCEGYDVARPDMEIVGDAINYSKSFFDKAFDPDKALGWKDYENFLGTIANMVGIPAKNLLREGRRAWNAVVNTQWTAPTGIGVGQAILENMPFYGSKNNEYYQRIVTAKVRGDDELAEDLRTYMLTSKMVTPDTLRSGIKTALKEAYIDGDTDDDTAIDMLVEIGAYEDRDDAYWEVDKWKYMQETGASADSYSKYNDFYTAVETGKDLKKTIQEYLDNGASKSTLASKITSQYKPQMIALKESGKGYADLQARILTAYEALGYDRQEKLKDIQKWFKTDGKK